MLLFNMCSQRLAVNAFLLCSSSAIAAFDLRCVQALSTLTDLKVPAILQWNEGPARIHHECCATVGAHAFGACIWSMHLEHASINGEATGAAFDVPGVTCKRQEADTQPVDGDVSLQVLQTAIRLRTLLIVPSPTQSECLWVQSERHQNCAAPRTLYLLNATK